MERWPDMFTIPERRNGNGELLDRQKKKKGGGLRSCKLIAKMDKGNKGKMKIIQLL